MGARKDALGLSNAMVDELSGFADGYFDKIAGPSRVKLPSLFSLMTTASGLSRASRRTHARGRQIMSLRT